MQMTWEHNGKQYQCDTREGRSIAITLDFEGPQPNHFGADPASSQPLKLGDFVGDTSAGGSCNVDDLRLIPHCNGTHTETISHIVDEEIWVGHAAMDGLSVARLVTVSPRRLDALSADDRQEGYRPPLDPHDRLITASMLQAAVGPGDAFQQIAPQSLIIRTLPNTNGKTTRAYGEQHQPAFLTVEAMALIVQWKIQHLLVDVPSVDRMYDDGLLTNHHLFWNVPETTHAVTEDSQQDKTITEMVYVDDDLDDGWYLLNLQIPGFGSDAAPSRPILFPMKASG